jgi:hypothetical protein
MAAVGFLAMTIGINELSVMIGLSTKKTLKLLHTSGMNLAPDNIRKAREVISEP